VTCAFGFRNFIYLDRDLQELHRVLKRGGRIYALEFYQPQSAFIGTLLQIYQRTVFPLVGYLVSRQTRAYKYLFSSIVGFKTREEFSGLLDKGGFLLLGSEQFFFGLAHLIVAEKKQNE
jgi:demethylmenaquinone methyltransferase/2-methoxy-6-polyprenyl-1,4-benzoquinol methylase